MFIQRGWVEDIYIFLKLLSKPLPFSAFYETMSE